MFLESVTVTKPLINPWIDYVKMKPEDQNEFLGKLLSQGRLSRRPGGNWIILSDRDSGAIYNPSFTDGSILYFVSKSDAIDFVKAKYSKLFKNFSCFKLCSGGCHN